jgi:hypothetical protein
VVNTENPETLLGSDSKAQAFYVLADKQVALCKPGEKPTALPYYKQRSSYISAGVISPANKKVCFWGDALEIDVCMEVLKDADAIDADFTYVLAGGRKMSATGHNVTKIELKKSATVDGIRRKGRAGFNRLPAGGTKDLQPQSGTMTSRPNIQQKDMPKSTGQGTITPTPSPKIEVRTSNGSDLKRQQVSKQVKPGSI